MKLFTATEAGVESGLPIVREPFPHVAVGEPGRGRFEARVGIGRRFIEGLAPEPCPARGKVLWESRCPGCGLADPCPPDAANHRPPHPDSGELPARRLYEADVLRSRARGTYLLVESRPAGEDRRALVVLRFSCGYRGGVTYSATEPVPCPNRGAGYADYRFHTGQCERCGVALTDAPKPADEPASVRRWLAHPADQGAVFTGATWPPAGVTVLASGQTAQGAAGRMGGGPEHLVVMAPGATVRVRREGRLYGDDGRYVVAWDGETLTVTPWLDWLGRQAVAAEEGERV